MEEEDENSEGNPSLSNVKEKPPESSTKARSFRDSLIRGTPSEPVSGQEMDLDESQEKNDYADLNSIELADEDLEDYMEKGYPALRVTEKAKRALATPWENSVIIKVLGRRMGYTALVDRLRRIWQPLGHIDVIDIEHDFFVVRFTNYKDRTHAMFDGPWVIMDSYLMVQEWSPAFSPSADLQSLTAWVRFPGLPIQYYNKQVLWRLGQRLGKPMKIDTTTQKVDRGRFARMAVSIDLAKPLVSKIFIDGHWVLVEYESLPSICYSCGRIGHTQGNCKHPSDPPELAPSDNMEENNRTGKGMEITQNGENYSNVETAGEDKEFHGDRKPCYGPWMQVQRPKRTSKVGPPMNLQGTGLVSPIRQVDHRAANPTNPRQSTSESEKVNLRGNHASRFEVLADFERDSTEVSVERWKKEGRIWAEKGESSISQQKREKASGITKVAFSAFKGDKSVKIRSFQKKKLTPDTDVITVGPLSHSSHIAKENQSQGRTKSKMPRTSKVQVTAMTGPVKHAELKVNRNLDFHAGVEVCYQTPYDPSLSEAPDPLPPNDANDLWRKRKKKLDQGVDKIPQPLTLNTNQDNLVSAPCLMACNDQDDSMGINDPKPRPQ